MHTMIDEIYDRQYQAGRAALNDGIDRLVTVIGAELGKSLAAIHQFEWSSPWNRSTKAKQNNCA